MKTTQKIVMTGATGHVGYALLLELINTGATPTILIRKESNIFDGLNCTKAFGDVTDPASLEKAFEGADIVYHSAGVIELKPGNEQLVYDVNVTGTKKPSVESCLSLPTSQSLSFPFLEANDVPLKHPGWW